MYVTFYFMFMSGMIMYCCYHKHFLLVLLSLEYMVLSVFVMMTFNFYLWGEGFYILIMYLTFTVCEGALGLSLLVSLVRCHGNDNLNSLSLLKW